MMKPQPKLQTVQIRPLSMAHLLCSAYFAKALVTAYTNLSVCAVRKMSNALETLRNLSEVGKRNEKGKI